MSDNMQAGNSGRFLIPYAALMALGALLLSQQANAQSGRALDVTTLTAQAAAQVTSDQSSSSVQLSTLIAQRMAAYLSNINAAVQRAVGLTQQQRELLQDDLSGDISFVQRQAMLINNADSDATMNARVSELRAYWIKKSAAVKYAISQIFTGRHQETIERLDGLNEKIAELIRRMDKAGSDTAALASLHSDFNARLEAADASLALARQEFAKLNTAEQTADAYQAGRAHLKASHEHLREARDMFRRLLQATRQQLPDRREVKRSQPSIQP